MIFKKDHVFHILWRQNKHTVKVKRMHAAGYFFQRSVLKILSDLNLFSEFWLLSITDRILLDLTLINEEEKLAIEQVALE